MGHSEWGQHDWVVIILGEIAKFHHNGWRDECVTSPTYMFMTSFIGVLMCVDSPLLCWGSCISLGISFVEQWWSVPACVDMRTYVNSGTFWKAMPPSSAPVDHSHNQRQCIWLIVLSHLVTDRKSAPIAEHERETASTTSMSWPLGHCFLSSLANTGL